MLGSQVKRSAGTRPNTPVFEEEDQENPEDQTDDVDERRHLKAYWRSEEGQGHQVADLSDKGIHLIADEG